MGASIFHSIFPWSKITEEPVRGNVVPISDERRNELRKLASEKVAKLLSQPQQSLQQDTIVGTLITQTGPRGGRFTEATTKDGRPYRRYF